MSGLALHYTPPGPVAGRFMASRGFIDAILGPIGSGKTTACIFKILQSMKLQKPGRLSSVRRARWAVIRNTYPELKTTTIFSWHQWVPETLGRWQSEGPPTHLVPLDLGNGDRAELEVIFLALDRPEDVRKLLSLELTGAWINEAREVPAEVLSHLQGRVGRYPPAADGGATWSGIIMDTNPPDTDSWFYQKFEDERPQGFTLFKQPGGRSAGAENLQNLPAGYYDRAAQGQTAEWIAVYIDAKYGYSRDGKPVFPEFADSIHVAPEPLRPHPKLPLLVGADAGLTPAAALLQQQPIGQWWILDEIVEVGMGAVRFGERLNQKLAEPHYRGLSVTGWCDPAAGARSPNDETVWSEVVTAASKIKFKLAPTNALLARLEAVRRPLSRLIDGRPGILISPSCRVLRKGFASGYRYRRVVTAGGVRFEDRPEKNEFSHPHDGLQYGMLGGGEYAEVTGRAERQRQAIASAPAEADGDYDPMRW